MFERYTEPARRSIFFARIEASEFSSRFIEPAHLMLGLLRESPDTFRPLFATPDAPEAIRKEYDARKAAAATPTSVDLPLNQQAKRSLSWAAEEAERLRHAHIGVEHLMLGLLREESSQAAQDLRRYGMTLAGAREAAARSRPILIETRPAPPSRWRPGREELHRLVDALDHTRLQAATRILEALTGQPVTISVTAPGVSEVFTFGEE